MYIIYLYNMCVCDIICPYIPSFLSLPSWVSIACRVMVVFSAWRACTTSSLCESSVSLWRLRAQQTGLRAGAKAQTSVYV